MSTLYTRDMPILSWIIFWSKWSLPFRETALLPRNFANQTRRVAHVDLVSRRTGRGRTIPLRNRDPETCTRRRGRNPLHRKSPQYSDTATQSKSGEERPSNEADLVEQFDTFSDDFSSLFNNRISVIIMSTHFNFKYFPTKVERLQDWNVMLAVGKIP